MRSTPNAHFMMLLPVLGRPAANGTSSENAKESASVKLLRPIPHTHFIFGPGRSSSDSESCSTISKSTSRPRVRTSKGYDDQSSARLIFSPFTLLTPNIKLSEFTDWPCVCALAQFLEPCPIATPIESRCVHTLRTLSPKSPTKSMASRLLVVLLRQNNTLSVLDSPPNARPLLLSLRSNL